MATVNLTIPGAQVQRVVAALCAAAGVEATAANAKQAIIDHIKATVSNVERKPPVEPPAPNVGGIVT